jgi:hypothetical protein
MKLIRRALYPVKLWLNIILNKLLKRECEKCKHIHRGSCLIATRRFDPKGSGACKYWRKR